MSSIIPWQGILGLTQVLKMKLGEGAEGALLGQVEAQANRCRDVVDTMLKLSASAEEDIRAERVSVHKHLVEVLELCRASFTQRGVELHLESFSNDIEMVVPVPQVSRISYQVLQCLRAGLSSGSKLVVGCEQTENSVVIMLTPSKPVATGTARDDWMASGAALWVARQMLEQINGRLEELIQVSLAGECIFQGGCMRQWLIPVILLVTFVLVMVWVLGNGSIFTGGQTGLLIKSVSGEVSSTRGWSTC